MESQILKEQKKIDNRLSDVFYYVKENEKIILFSEVIEDRDNGHINIYNAKEMAGIIKGEII